MTLKMNGGNIKFVLSKIKSDINNMLIVTCDEIAAHFCWTQSMSEHYI